MADTREIDPAGKIASSSSASIFDNAARLSFGLLSDDKDALKASSTEAQELLPALTLALTFSIKEVLMTIIRLIMRVGRHSPRL
jgi:hypothetical protein